MKFRMWKVFFNRIFKHPSLFLTREHFENWKKMVITIEQNLWQISYKHFLRNLLMLFYNISVFWRISRWMVNKFCDCTAYRRTTFQESQSLPPLKIRLEVNWDKASENMKSHFLKFSTKLENKIILSNQTKRLKIS